MRILIDINHPAHVHYFRNFHKIMTRNGHEVLVISRNKEIEHTLLRSFNIPFISRGKGSNGKYRRFFYMLYADLKILLAALRFDPDVFLNFLHPYPSHVASLLGKVSLVFSDTEHARLHHRLTVPFATKVLTPACYRIDLGKKHVRFNGYMELAYLHPNYFRPDRDVLRLLNLSESDKFVIVRFVSWAAVHDFGHTGMTLENKRWTVKELSKHARVFISSESALPADLEQYRISIPKQKMHDALYYCSLLFGESATMASEAAVLGTPAIFVDNNGRGYTDEQESRYGLVYNFTESNEQQEQAIRKALQIIQDRAAREKFREKTRALLSNCVDTTEFMIAQVLKYEKATSSLTRVAS